MSFDMQTTGLQLRSLVKASGELELSLARIPVQPPGPGEILVRVEGSPINPSDLGLLVSAADMSQAKASGTADSPVITAPVPPAYMKAVAARVDDSMPVGNEGAGVVVAAGEGAEGLIGKTVAILGGAMYAQYRTVKAADALLLPEDVTPAEGASCFVNPLTALGMVETMRREGHTALVHTAAASNLGQMLNRLCLKDGVALVNIVRSAEQAALLKRQGAVHVLDSTSPNFTEELTEALVTTGATLAFDAIGGGRLVGQILTAMEVAANRKATEYSRYGSTTYKQAYIYGGLDTRPTELNRGFGMSWGVGGWLLTPFLMKIGAEAAQALRQRVASELKTTFASHYTAEISLAEALQPDILAAYNRRATGEKYLINPNKGV
ncbi:zinc-binding dehydrogenase [Phenylobacterium sp.]|jgi:NADPH:quinone reductase-like Zn-dependent oxidoreductase|uniref:zinc-binding dehydrogenase n=1 Tax=Phenylobacterium sp. TaxID=1871053 RepID=UPI0025DBFAF4|nr:zinc-binding dehydrogenase [Phenylobacterium sp.]|tara:strand:- start:1386 stop:2525 length:1140 start_codon:yes stop_codon:yes gene_type:complete